MKKVVSWIILALLLIGALTLAFNVGMVRAQASETVYINSARPNARVNALCQDLIVMTWHPLNYLAVCG